MNQQQFEAMQRLVDCAGALIVNKMYKGASTNPPNVYLEIETRHDKQADLVKRYRITIEPNGKNQMQEL